MQVWPEEERHPSQRKLGRGRNNQLTSLRSKLKIHPSFYQHLRKTGGEHEA